MLLILPVDEYGQIGRATRLLAQIQIIVFEEGANL